MSQPRAMIACLVVCAASSAGCSPLIAAIYHLSQRGAGGSQLPIGQAVSGSTDGEGDDYTLPCGSPRPSGDDEWVFVPPRSAVYRFHVTADYDSVLAVLRGGDETDSVGCNDDYGSTRESLVSAALDAGVRYVVVVDGYHGAQGSYELTVTELQPVQRGGALVLGQSVSGSTTGEPDGYTPPCGSVAGSGDVAYTFTPTTTGQYELYVEAEYDNTLAVYGPDQATPIGCNDDYGAIGRSQVVASLMAGQTYTVVVDGYGGREGTFTLVARPVAPPEPPPSDTAALAGLCEAAPVLQGGSTSGEIQAGPSQAHLSCGGGGRGAEAIYRVEISEPSSLAVQEESGFDAVLELRRGCTGGAQVLACVDDAPDTRHSAIAARLEPGTYYLIVDAHGPDGGGPFTLSTTITPDAQAEPEPEQ